MLCCVNVDDDDLSYFVPLVIAGGEYMQESPGGQRVGGWKRGIGKRKRESERDEAPRVQYRPS